MTVIVDGAEENGGLISLFADWLEDRWDQGLEGRVNALESGAPPDPAATALSDLLVAGLGAVPPDRRVVVLDPPGGASAGARFGAFDGEFPELP